MDSIAKINKILAEKGITGAELERMIGVSRSAYSQWNTRKNKPSNASLAKIAKALNVSASDLMDDLDEVIEEKQTSDMDEMLQLIKDNPGMRILFNKAKNATPEQLFAIAQMIDTFRNGG